MELQGKTLGVVGLGKVGTYLGKRGVNIAGCQLGRKVKLWMN